MDKKVLGLDIGGTHMRIGIIDDQKRAHHVRVVSSDILTKHSDIIADLSQYIDEYLTELGETVAAISIGVPSAVAGDYKTVVLAPNLKDKNGGYVMKNLDLATPLAERFQIPVLVDKDTDFLLSYDRYAMKLEHVNGIVAGYIGTGFGGSVFFDGKFLKGKNGVAMDIGHIPFYHSGELCNCGKIGCVEAHASGNVLQNIWKQHFTDTSFTDIFTRHREEQVIREFVYCCALPFATMATIFSPDVMIAGGGVLEMVDFPKQYFEKCIREQTGRAVAEAGINVRYSAVVKEKGIIGAAICADMYLAGGLR